MNWQDVYKLPLHNFSKVKAFSSNSVIAYDYLDWKQPQEYYDHIVAVINGDILRDNPILSNSGGHRHIIECC